jgi:hypothetical protein
MHRTGYRSSLLPSILALLVLLTALPLCAGVAYEFERRWHRDEIRYTSGSERRVVADAGADRGTVYVEGANIRIEFDGTATPKSEVVISNDGGATFRRLDLARRSWSPEGSLACGAAARGLVQGARSRVSVVSASDPQPSRGGTSSRQLRLSQQLTARTLLFATSVTRHWSVDLVSSGNPLPHAAAIVKLFDEDEIFRCAEVCGSGVVSLAATSRGVAKEIEEPLVTRVEIRFGNPRSWEPSPGAFETPQSFTWAKHRMK